jgi:hypothetical protein
MPFFVSKCCGAPVENTEDTDPAPVKMWYYKCSKCKKGCGPVKVEGRKKNEAPAV